MKVHLHDFWGPADDTADVYRLDTSSARGKKKRAPQPQLPARAAAVPAVGAPSSGVGSGPSGGAPAAAQVGGFPSGIPIGPGEPLPPFGFPPPPISNPPMPPPDSIAIPTDKDNEPEDPEDPPKGPPRDDDPREDLKDKLNPEPGGGGAG